MWLGELWNSNKAMIPKKHTDEVLKFVNNPNIVAENLHIFNREQPGKLLSSLQSAEFAPSELYLSSKLLWGQLSPEVIESEIINRPEINVVYLLRNPISTFISLTKARRSEVWNGVDQTDFKPNLEVEEWVNWLKHREQFIDFIKTNHSKTSQVIFYENILSQNLLDHRKLAKKLRKLQNFPHIETESRIRKQDNLRRPTDRVGNWREFKKEIQIKNLQPNYREEVKSLKRLYFLRQLQYFLRQLQFFETLNRLGAKATNASTNHEE
jgi:hypothetical protein